MPNKMTTKGKTLTQTVLADGRIELSGPTFDVREEIKTAAGGKAVWDGSRRVWIVPAGTVVPVVKSREEWSREEWQVWSSVYRIRNRGRVEQCCSGARDIGEMYGPSIYSCVRHGETRGSFTGD